MTTLTTITEKEILQAAYDDRLRKWVDKINSNERSIKERGRSNLIATFWIKKYQEIPRNTENNSMSWT